MSMQNTFVLVGSILGFVSFAWNLIGVITSHVTIDVSVQQPVTNVNGDQHTTALITIDNTRGVTRRLHYAVLLIAPQEESLYVASKEFFDYSRLGSLRKLYQNQQLAEDGTHLLIPLPLFYRDNFTIGNNERIKQRLRIDTESLASGTYNVYLLIYVQYHPFRYIRWRVTSDALFLD
jgi:hypothetical protein